MISRVTIFSLLTGLMLGTGIYLRVQQQVDRCNSYPEGGIPPKSEYVVTGTRQVEVPCSDWWIRQPQTLQILCIADAALGVLFVFSALQDLRGWLAWRHTQKNADHASEQ